MVVLLSVERDLESWESLGERRCHLPSASVFIKMTVSDLLETNVVKQAFCTFAVLGHTGFFYWNESFSSKSNETAAFWCSEVLHLPIKQLLLWICFLFLADSFIVEMHDTAALKKWVERCTMKFRSTNLGSIIFFSNLCHAWVWRAFLPN